MANITDFGNYHGLIWYNGELINWNDCTLHMLSHSLHYGGMVFEGLRAYGGKIFKLEQHTQRLQSSAEIIGYDLPYSAEEINQACKDVMQANGLQDAYLRPAAWRGSKAMGIAHQNNPIHLAVAAWEWPSYFNEDTLLKGLRLRTSMWRRPAPGTAPVFSKASGLYQICTMAKDEAEKQGFDDALMLDYRGFVAESTGSNIFFFMNDGTLHTPTPDCFLDGITRQTVIKIAQAAGIQVIERTIAFDELNDVAEAFLTGTAIEIAPIACIDNIKFTPADFTASMIKAYGDIVRSL